LEFPVVFIADLGRSKGGRSGSPYLLHDPEFGMVCKVRDENGDWVKPVPGGYGWAKWVNDSMEDAENKRLLYVACTRASDLLILSGKLSGWDNWLSDILDAWDIPDEGDKEERISFDHYKLQVFRPKELPESITTSINSKEESLSLFSVSSLAKPYLQEGLMTSLSVSALTDMLEKTDAQSQIRPVIWDEHQEKTREHVPGYKLGNIVHHTLSHGFFDGQSENQLIEIIENFGRQEGLRSNALSKAVRQTYQMLTKLRRHRVYEEIEGAKRCLHEVSFSWTSPIGEVHGVIDLLYQNQVEEWYLLDWKTDYMTNMNLKELEDKYQKQISIYFHAASIILKINPETRLVFLNPKTYVIDIIPEDIGFLEKMVVNTKY